MIHKPLTPEEREDFEMSPADEKYVNKFWKVIAWAFGILSSTALWCYLIIKYIVRP